MIKTLLLLTLLHSTLIYSLSASEMQDSVKVRNKLGDDLKKGEFDFHARSFFMGTINAGSLLNYSTLATGAGVGYTSPEWRGFQIRFNGFFTFQVFENNIRIPDPITGGVNRYELLLYDMNDLTNTNRLDRLEELYIAYRKNRIKFTFGRQKVSSPLLNEQDNRMRPNVFGGLSMVYSGVSTKWTAMWINSMTIRGTVDWYTVENSVGVYPFGRNPFGQPSNYKGKISSRGIGLLGVQHYKDGFTGQFWNYTAENMFNMSFAQADYNLNVGKTRFYGGLQGFYQFALNDGGNPDPDFTYMLPDERALGVGGKLGGFYNTHNVSLNYLWISDKGRFLFPREWGREILYASLPRERYEGAGDLTALILKYDWVTPLPNVFTQFGAGMVNHSKMDNYSTNKYGLPSYYHFIGGIEYRFQEYLQGLNLNLLLVNKTAKNRSVLTDNQRINRVDMWNINLVMDYRF
jgi:hypothetical protein